MKIDYVNAEKVFSKEYLNEETYTTGSSIPFIPLAADPNNDDIVKCIVKTIAPYYDVYHKFSLLVELRGALKEIEYCVKKGSKIELSAVVFKGITERDYIPCIVKITNISPNYISLKILSGSKEFTLQ